MLLSIARSKTNIHFSYSETDGYVKFKFSKVPRNAIKSPRVFKIIVLLIYGKPGRHVVSMSREPQAEKFQLNILFIYSARVKWCRVLTFDGELVGQLLVKINFESDGKFRIIF